MDKKLVMLLEENGWTLTRIANRVGRTVARISQIVSESQTAPKNDKEHCEVCGVKLQSECKIEIEGIEPFLVCETCFGKYSS